MIALILCAIYYAALAFIKIPYITIGILSFAYTFSTFEVEEVVTVVFLIAMMIFMGVRKIPVLVFVPIGTTLFLSSRIPHILTCASAIEREKGK